MNTLSARKLLGVSAGADLTEVKKAYRSLAMKHHPDREGGNEEKFKEIQQAYEFLEKYAFSKPEAGAKYERAWADAAAHSKKYDWSTFYGNSKNREYADFDDLYGATHSYKDTEDAYEEEFDEPYDVRIVRFKITPLEALNGCTKTVKFKHSALDISLDVNVIPGVANNADHVVSHTIDRTKYMFVPEILSEGFKISFIKESYGTVNSEIKISPFMMIAGGWVKVQTLFDGEVEVRIPEAFQSGGLLKISGRGYLLKGKIKRADMLVRVIVDIKKLEDYTVKEVTDFINLVKNRNDNNNAD